MQIVRLCAQLPEGWRTLLAAAQAESYAHMDRLAADWADGQQRFNRQGEALFAALIGGDLAGIGGLTREPSDPQGDLMRARRLYVLPAMRGRGAGRRLVEAIVQHGFQTVGRITVNAGRDAGEFWPKMGFSKIDGRPFSHERRRS